MRDIKTPALIELLERIPGWRDMSPIDVVTAVGKAEADDVFHQFFAAIAEDTIPQT